MLNINLQALLIVSSSKKTWDYNLLDDFMYCFSKKNDVKLLLIGTDGNVNFYNELI